MSKVEEIMELHNDPIDLNNILYNVQEKYMHIPEYVVEYIASELGIIANEIYKKATFYSHWQI